jgi:hypothetical protein
MHRLGRFPLEIVLILLTMGGVVAALVTAGGRMFSPGDLNAHSRQDIELGGVASHAGLGGNCAACHTAPWNSETMADRCLGCHADVRRQFEAHRPLHGTLSEGMQCRGCHTEHNGAEAALTSVARFDHDWTAFPLTGQHRQVACASCHVNSVFHGIAQTCVSCHAEPQVHRGRLGTDCVQCHSTSTWKGATFTHKFPLNHGHRRENIACSVCHTVATDFRTYTCYGCHEHQPARVESKHVRMGIGNFQNCVRCHPTGREHEGRRGRDD